MSDNTAYLDESQEQILVNLQKAYDKMVNEQVDLKILCGNLKKENKQLKEMLQKWTDENIMLQESLDQCERENEQLVDELEELLIKREGG